jgi:hypothetical protein
MIINSSNINTFNPIQSINTYAKEYADTIIYLNRKNINTSLKKAKNYKYALITVEEHTIVKVINYEEEIISGSWGAKMPYGKGYVKKKLKLSFYEDHINYIIGLPDNQERILFLFNNQKKIK